MTQPARSGSPGRRKACRRGSRTVDFHRCTACDVLAHWIDPKLRVEKMGIHMQNCPRALLGDIRVVVEP